jgi:hypothetical protein
LHGCTLAFSLSAELSSLAPSSKFKDFKQEVLADSGIVFPGKSPDTSVGVEDLFNFNLLIYCLLVHGPSFGFALWGFLLDGVFMGCVSSVNNTLLSDAASWKFLHHTQDLDLFPP